MIDYMVRQVTPPRRVTSPTWGPPPPCKQALSVCLFQVRMVFEAFLSLKSLRFWRADVLHCSPRIGNYLEKGPVKVSKFSVENTSSETQGRSVGSRKTKTKVFKNGWESPWDATFDEQVPRFIRMLSNWEQKKNIVPNRRPAQAIVLL